MIPSGVLLVALTIVAGWIVLLPVRHRLGAAWYHLLAYPLGLPAWTFVLAVAGALQLPYNVLIVVTGWVAYAGFGFACMRLLRGKAASFTARSANPWWGYAVTAVVAMGATMAAWRLGMSFSTDDSIMAYETLGIWLRDTGTLTTRLMSERSPLVPAIHAANRMFGGEWGFVHYPVLGFNVFLLVLLALWEMAEPLRTWMRGSLAVVVALLMGLAPSFVFHTFYVHSHMVTASYLLIAVLALWKATGGRLDASDAEPAWMAVAGLASAGLVLARPDGLAYVFVVVAVVASLFLSTGMRRESAVAYFAILLAVVAVPYAVALARLGLWTKGKLDAQLSLELFALIAVSALALMAFGETRLSARFLGRSSNLLILVLLLDVLLITALYFLRNEEFARAMKNMTGNLAKSGGYQSLWWVATAIVLVSVLQFWGRFRTDWLGHVLFVVVQFLAVAVVVHVNRNPGRLSPSDSFSRVAFHIVPVIFVYIGFWSSKLIDGLTRATRSNGAPY